MRKAWFARAVLWVGAAAMCGPALHAQDESATPQTAEDKAASATLLALVDLCGPAETASGLQDTLLSQGWERIGGVPPSLDPTSRNLERDGVAILEGWRFFHREGRPEILSFTTAPNAPDLVEDCLVDGNGIDPQRVVVQAISAFGKPVRGEPGYAHWSDWLHTGRTLFIAESMAVEPKYEGSVMFVVRRSAEPKTETKADTEQP